MARQVASNDHLHPKRIAFSADRHIGRGRVGQPVGADIGRRLQHPGGDLVQYLSFEGNGPGEDDVECRDTVGRDHDQPFAVDGIYVPHFAPIKIRLVGELECVHASKLNFHYYITMCILLLIATSLNSKRKLALWEMLYQSLPSCWLRLLSSPLPLLHSLPSRSQVTYTMR